jgi:hypothetical protein
VKPYEQKELEEMDYSDNEKNSGMKGETILISPGNYNSLCH